MREQHLSDEAVAAFADDVLIGAPRERARRHVAQCAECHYAVAGQREAVWALRAAPAPALPGGLLDRLREVPVTTPIRVLPSSVDEHGNALFATAAAPMAGLVPVRPASRSRRVSPVVLTAATLAVAGVLGFTAADSAVTPPATSHPQPANVRVPAANFGQFPAQFVRAVHSHRQR